MFSTVILLALQAATTQQVALASATDTPTQQQTAEPAGAEPQTRKVCRKVLDTRTGLIAKPRKICRTVPVDGDSAN
jgi:hypothetical protein